MNAHIKRLDLSYCRGITTAGWRALFELLQSPNCALEELSLYDNRFNAETVSFLANALVNNNRLRELDLRLNLNVSSNGWEALSVVLQSPNSALEKLNLRRNTINDDTVISLANSLANNNTLKELLFTFNEEHSDDDSDDLVSYITDASGWTAFSRILCNTSSIMDTYRSNHTLQRLTDDDDEVRLPEDLNSMLHLNREKGKRQAARLKIIRTHFPGGFVVEPFVGMDLNVLPHAIAWMGRDGADEVDEHLYGFLRIMPSLFDVDHSANRMEEDL